MGEASGVGLYIHIPFCLAKCAYCDFNSYAQLDGLFDEYVASLVQEADFADRVSVRTVYIGGGTPTVLPLFLFTRIFDAIEDRFAAHATCEITVEANPGTVSLEKLEGLRALGVNRLSLGVQSFMDGELRMLGRIHNRSVATQAFQAARSAGFDNLSLDLLYGLPKQRLSSWQASLERALALQPDHLSLYCLTLEDGTPLANAIARGQLPAPDPDLAADMYELAQGVLASAGFTHYEISNWARSPELVCQHNLTYWRNEAYLGLGAGAHSWMGQRRWSNLLHPEEYIRQVQSGLHPTEMQESINLDLEMGETMMLGLRLLREGVVISRFQARFGLDPRARYADELRKLSALGLVDITGERVVLSPRGRLLGNQVFLHFVGDHTTTDYTVDLKT
jgi:oxygen-independent coproporphyrinogen-3 oxidase